MTEPNEPNLTNSDAIPAAPPVQPVAHVAPVKEIPLDDEGNLSETVPCRRCSYILKGLSPASVCPECTLPIARSVLGDELRFCDPSWVRTVAQGIKVILISIFTMIGLVVLFIVGMIAYIFLVAAQTGGPPNMAFVQAGSLVFLFPMLIAIFGIWRMTTPDPGQIESETSINARTLARWCIMAILVSMPISIMTSQQMMITPGTPPPSLSATMQALQWVGFLFGAISMVGYIAMLTMLGRLADRVPNPSLVKQSKIVTWGFGISQSLAFVLGIIVTIMIPAVTASIAANTPPQNAIVYYVAVGGGGITSCFSLIFMIWAIVLMFLVYAAIKKETVKAHEHWGEG
ncbi:MAG: hypothetical protein O7G85_15790 [Planctomycetota bacterium]|nr:hypothetical protein [Planctomycetota bacterium]